jgi:quercetin dioxygenase-like cupin family protein
MSHYFRDLHQHGRHTIFPDVTIRTAGGERIWLSLASLAARSVVEEHAHPHEQVGMIVSGRVVFTIGGEEREAGPGDFYFIPGGVPQGAGAGRAGGGTGHLRDGPGGAPVSGLPDVFTGRRPGKPHTQVCPT